MTATFDVEFIRDKARALPTERLPERVRSLRVWHCAYKTFQPLQRLCSASMASTPTITIERPLRHDDGQLHATAWKLTPARALNS